MALRRTRWLQAADIQHRLGRMLRSPLRLVLAGALLGACTAAWAIELHNGTIAGGGGQASEGSLHLVATHGEPVMGVSARDGWVLTAGFPATLAASAPAGDRLLFRDGFESDPEGEPAP